jgi:5-methylcytosine-specific restriction endonuclease McrA
MPKERGSEKRRAESNVLPMRESEDPREWRLFDSYTLKRQDEEYFGGLREAVLERDGYCCRVCGASGRRKRSIVVHHRVPGKSLLHLMISLCPNCHAKVGRTQLVLSEMPPLLLELWREQHPEGHEQTTLNFRASGRSCLLKSAQPIQDHRTDYSSPIVLNGPK